MSMKNYIKLLENVAQEDASRRLGYWPSSSGKIELLLTAEDVDSIAVGGADNEAAVREVIKEPYVRYQLSKIQDNVLHDEVTEMVPDIEETGRETLEMYLIWLAAWDIKEEDSYYNDLVQDEDLEKIKSLIEDHYNESEEVVMSESEDESEDFSQWTDQDDIITLELSQEDAKAITSAGMTNTDAIEEVSEKEYIKTQIEDMSEENIRNVLMNYGAWEEWQLDDEVGNVYRLLWLAGHHVYDVREDLSDVE